MATLEIRDLHVSVADPTPGADGRDGSREILRGVDLTVASGEVHAIMGPNGSGKSTLAYAIAGHPKYLVTRGSVTLDGEDVLPGFRCPLAEIMPPEGEHETDAAPD